MHSEPVLGPLALIRQSQRQTHMQFDCHRHPKTLNALESA